MTGEPSRTHFAAIMSRLDSLTGPPSRYQLYQGKITVADTELSFPYLIGWQSPGDLSIVNFTGTLSDVTTLTQITAVGRDSDEVMAALDRAAALLHGYKPSIVDRDCGFIRQVPGNPYVLPIDDVHTPEGQPTYQGIGQFTLTSGPAPSND